jgi:hypothetical protein
MKSPIMPLICGVAVAAMTAAGLSHWWSVRQFITVMNAEGPISRVQVIAAAGKPAPAASNEPAAPLPAPQTAAASAAAPLNAAPDPGQMQFYEKLLTRMESLQNQNRDLLDQLAETNRDLMKLEFRVDTHSEQFRPLPVAEDRMGTTFGTGQEIDLGTSFDEGPGLLPPRALPVE